MKMKKMKVFFCFVPFKMQLSFIAQQRVADDVSDGYDPTPSARQQHEMAHNKQVINPFPNE